MSSVRVVLVDDQEMVRSGLALILRSDPDIEIVAEYADGQDLVESVAARHADIVVTDIRMPRMDGIEAVTRLRARPTSPPILALTTFDDDDVLWPTLAAGVNGFVLKDSPAEALLQAVGAVAAGGAWLDPRVLPRVLTSALTGRSAQPASAVLQHLTPREREVLDLLCEGLSNIEIADTIGASERTVKAHVSAVLQKLDARDRAVAIVIAYDAGWRRR